MRTFTAAFVFLILLSTCALAQSDSLHYAAQELLRRGIEACDAGDYDGALDLYHQAEALDSGSSMYRYEESYIYTYQQQYQRAIDILLTIVNAPDAHDIYYSNLGSCYDYLGKREKALATYKEGLKRFPNSGRIYLELGVVMASEQKFEKALGYWEKGIEVDPAHPSNYYWASKFYCTIDQTRPWGIIYAEIFLNLERSTNRSKEISGLLYEAYRSLISVEPGHIGIADISGKPIMDTATGTMVVPFDQAFGTKLITALTVNAIFPLHQGVDLAFLHSARSLFISMWFEDSLDQYFPSFLFNWHRELIERGGFEAYNYWLLNQGDEGEATEWFNAHADQAASFMNWFKQHPLQISRAEAWNHRNAGSMPLEKWTKLTSSKKKDKDK